MRTFCVLCASFLLMSLGHLSAEQLPEMRPALLGTGPRSLINLIDIKRLMKRGQGDAVVRFSVHVNNYGDSYFMVTSRSNSDSDALEQEVVAKAPRAKFIPAVYHSRTTTAIVSGTIVFAVINGKPHLRIFLNQEEEHLKHGDDFISPQPVLLWNDTFEGFEHPSNPSFSGTVAVSLNTDATGKVLDSRVTFESPRGWGLADAVRRQMGKLTFLPGYLRGKPVACSTTWHILFKG